MSPPHLSATAAPALAPSQIARTGIDKSAAPGALIGSAMAMSDSEAVIGARLFQSGNPEVARRLAALRPHARSVAAGEMIFEAAEAADSIFLLAGPRDGGANAAEPLVQIRLAGDSSGRGLRFARVVRGDIFGEAEFLAAGLDPKPSTRISSARALTPARIIGLAWRDVAVLFDADPAIRTRLLKLATRRLVDAAQTQHSHGHEDPDIVLADWLVEFAADLGVAASNRVSFPKKLNQSEIADELGVSRETISRRLKEWERSGLVTSSAGGLEVVDYSRLVRIAGLHSGRDRAALARAVADVAGEIDRGDLINARNIAADMLRYFPASPELLHQAALAAARSGDRDEAIAILAGAHLEPEGDLEALRARVIQALRNPFAAPGRVKADDWDDEVFSDDEEDGAADLRLVERLVTDLAALEARLLKDEAFERSAEGDPAVAAKSQQTYEAIWRRVGSWYAGINAAAMALAAGNAVAAKGLAAEVLRRLPEKAADYWATATLAEARFIAGDTEGGLAALAKASKAAEATDSAKASTMLQLRRLAPRLGLPMQEIGAELGLKSVVITTGHMFRGAEMDADRQKEADAAVRAGANAIFAAEHVGNLFGALACGADIVLAEAALDADIQFHAVLPFPLSRYVELSVNIGDPKGYEGHWLARFESVLARASSLTLVDDELPLDRDLDGHFFYSFRFMAGLALMRAGVLEAECRLIAVTDGTKATNVAGSNKAVADWLAAGRGVDEIKFPFNRKAPGGRARGTSSFRPVVLLWDVGGGGADEAAIKAALKRKDLAAKKAEFRIVARSSRVGGEGTAIVAPTLDAAMRLAEACADAAEKAGPLRVIADFGPVLGADLEPDEKMIARLKAGSDLPGFPSGRPLATLSFAAQAVFEFGPRLDVRAVGRADETREGVGKARRRSGLPVYRVALRG